MNNIRALIILITIVFFSSCNKEEENTEIDIGHTVTFLSIGKYETVYEAVSNGRNEGICACSAG